MKKNRPLYTLFLLITLVATSLSGCMFRPHRVTVQQGKILTQKMIKAIIPGMTRDQIVYILGTPDIVDPFSPNTMIYVYTNQVGYLPRSTRKLILTLSDGKLIKLSGNYSPPSRLAYKVYKTK